MYTNFLVDTKNDTYLTPYGLSILDEKPYKDLNILVNKNGIIQPKKEHTRKLFDLPRDNNPVEKENCKYKSFF
jgi:hypothetical protein